MAIKDQFRVHRTMAIAAAKSKEGVVGTLLRYLEFHEKLHPQSFEAVVDKLLEHPDFDPEKLVALLKQRHVNAG